MPNRHQAIKTDSDSADSRNTLIRSTMDVTQMACQIVASAVTPAQQHHEHEQRGRSHLEHFTQAAALLPGALGVCGFPAHHKDSGDQGLKAQHGLVAELMKNALSRPGMCTGPPQRRTQHPAHLKKAPRHGRLIARQPAKGPQSRMSHA